jgi:hypothetical protein
MHRLTATVFLLVASLSFVLPSCCCNKGLEGANACSWVLTCVELDHSLVQNAGTLPIYRRSDGYTFGREPVAMGTMQGSREGLWSIRVTFQEPVVAFSGRQGVHEYDVLTLSGKVCPKDETLIMGQGAFPSQVANGIATEVRVNRISDTKMKIQPLTRGRPLPYIFLFDSTPPQPRQVSIPLL